VKQSLDAVSELLRKLERPRKEGFIVFHVAEKHGKNPFLLLVSIILSQNTSDLNALKALKNLEERGLTAPERVAAAGEEAVFEAVRISGLGKIKAERILSLSKFLLERKTFFEDICRDRERARQELLKLRGIGQKTADVFLLVYCGHETFPVDRHILRVTERIAGRKMSYEEASSFWKERLLPEEYEESHLKLIEIGRKYCRPRSPLCKSCPLRGGCSTGRKAAVD